MEIKFQNFDIRTFLTAFHFGSSLAMHQHVGIEIAYRNAMNASHTGDMLRL